MNTIYQEFLQHAEKLPDKEALYCEGVSLNYSELQSRVRTASSVMAAAGVRQGDHIGVLLPNCTAFVTLMLAAAELGAVLVPLNPSLPPTAIAKNFRAADVRHAVFAPRLLDFDPEVALGQSGAVAGAGIALKDISSESDALEMAWPGTPGGLGVHSLGREPRVDAPFILTMTSGSTGDPKPIVLTQRTKLNRARAAIAMYGVTPADRTLAATPLYHSLAMRLVLIPLLSGGTSILMPRFSRSEWLKVIAEQSVSFTIAVSSQLNQIAGILSDLAGRETASLRCVVSSSALIEPQVKQQLVSKLRCDFHECYGASEIAIATNLDAQAAAHKLKSVGNAAPGVEIRILGDDGQPVGIGEAGEIACKTPMGFEGYYQQPEKTRAAMWGEFFKTGDIGRLDEDGYLYFLGRKKEIIITGGINVYPADVEGAVMDSGLVAEVAAFSIPDDRLGEIVAVALVPKHPATFDLRAVRLWCARNLADYQQPRQWSVLDQLPKNAMGKIMKRTLQDELGNPKS